MVHRHLYGRRYFVTRSSLAHRKIMAEEIGRHLGHDITSKLQENGLDIVEVGEAGSAYAFDVYLVFESSADAMLFKLKGLLR